MKKKITRENILHITLTMIDDAGSSQTLNMRAVARGLGCAHTNLYNYFDSWDYLLWSCAEAALAHLKYELSGSGSTAEMYKRILLFYLNHSGWFRLVWFDRLQGSRLGLIDDAVYGVVDEMLSVLRNVFQGISREQAHYIAHNVHCYLHGEISIYLSGRGLRKNEAEFREYVIAQCQKLSQLLAENLN